MNVHVVLIYVHAVNEECRVLFAGVKKALLEHGFNVVFEPGVSVLGAPDNVVLKFVRTMIQVPGFHEHSLAKRGWFC